MLFAAVLAGIGLLLMGIGALIMAEGVGHAMNEYSKIMQSIKPMLDNMIKMSPFNDKKESVPDFPPADWFKE